MHKEEHKEGGLQPIFSEIHPHQKPSGKKLGLEVTMAVQPDFSGLGADVRMDGSASMREEGNYTSDGSDPNPVEVALRNIVPFIANKTVNGSCRVGYWATGEFGTGNEEVGEISTQAAFTAAYPGPQNFGDATHLLSALFPMVRHAYQRRNQYKTLFGIIASDGKFHDLEEVLEYTNLIAEAIMRGLLPSIFVTIAGVGYDVDKTQLSKLMHKGTPHWYPGREIFCYVLAEHLGQLDEVVSHMVSREQPAMYVQSAFVRDDGTGQVVQRFNRTIPAVFEFEIDHHTTSFTLVIKAEDGSEQEYTQVIAQIPEHDEEGEDDDHDDEDEEGEGDARVQYEQLSDTELLPRLGIHTRSFGYASTYVGFGALSYDQPPRFLEHPLLWIGYWVDKLMS